MRKEYDLFLPWGDDKDKNAFAAVTDEFLFRLNPHWVVNDFSSSALSYSAEIKDHETSHSSTLTGKILREGGALLSLSSDGDEWEQINFFAKNSSLHAEVIYSKEPEESVERKTVLWLRSIKQYLRLYKTNTINTRFFRLLMNRVILPMTPSQRKISLMLIRVTILELLVIILILVGWFFFFR